MTLYGVDLWAAALVFARLGGLIMLLPGFGEAVVPARVRLSLALALTIAVAPTLAGGLPAPPAGAWPMAGAVTRELLVGIGLGGVARMLMSALATAGQIMGLDSGLSFAQTADPTAFQSGAIFAVFLGLMGATLVFATGLDHMFLRGIVGSYQLIAAGGEAPIGDMTTLALDAVSTSFRVGFQIAAPLVAAGLIFRLGLGALARLIPAIQVFFVALPLNVLGAFVVIALGLSTGMLVWLDSMQEYAGSLR